MRATQQEKAPFRTLTHVKPHEGEMIKPAETIDIVGTENLTLQDRLIWNSLIAEAFGPGMGSAGKEFKISISELRKNHKGNERIEVSIERLMKTVVRLDLGGGKIRRFQLLGGNDMGDSDREHGTLTYSFDRRLTELLQHSSLFGKLEIEVMGAFQSKYALALYEHMSRKINLSRVYEADYSVEDFRKILGVKDGQLKAFGSLKQKAITPALEEINGLCHYRVWISTRRTGRRISQVRLHWRWKDKENRKLAEEELQRPKLGRRARLRGEAGIIVEFDNVPFDDSAKPLD